MVIPGVLALLLVGCTRMTGPDPVDTEVPDTDTDPDTDTETDTDPDTDTDPEAPLRVVITRSVPDLGSFPSPLDGALIVSSTFGPRHLRTGDRDEFHTGLDARGHRGDPVRAIATGTVFRVVPGSGPDDGNILYTEHIVEPFDWQGIVMDRFYVVYGHLDGFELAVGDPVVAGTVVARMGDSGATSVHLHIEIRLNSHCSLAYQVANPTSTCGDGIDPAISPFNLIRSTRAGGVRLEVEGRDPLEVRVTTDLDDADLNRIHTDLGTLDFDLRTGLDAMRPAAIDNLDFGWMQIAPESVEHEVETEIVWHLRFPGAQPAFIEVTDVYGEGLRLAP